MSDHTDLQRIFEAHEPTVDWPALGPAELLATADGPPKWDTLFLNGLEVAFVFDDQGKLLGAYNWKE